MAKMKQKSQGIVLLQGQASWPFVKWNVEDGTVIIIHKVSKERVYQGEIIQIHQCHQ